MGKDYSAMSVRELEELKSLVLDRIGAVPAFRRGSLQVGYRKCGRANCRCARPGEQGHGPRGLWTRTVKGAGSRAQYIPVEEVAQVRAELDNYAQFEDLVADYVEINEVLCKVRVQPPKRGRPRSPAEPAPGGKKGGPARTRRR